MSQENEEHLTPFQLARRKFMNQSNNNDTEKFKSNQRSNTISGPPSRPIQKTQPPPNQNKTEESEENLTPFQIAQRRFRSSTNLTTPPAKSSTTKQPPPSQKQEGSKPISTKESPTTNNQSTSSSNTDKIPAPLQDKPQPQQEAPTPPQAKPQPPQVKPQPPQVKPQPPQVKPQPPQKPSIPPPQEAPAPPQTKPQPPQVKPQPPQKASTPPPQEAPIPPQFKPPPPQNKPQPSRDASPPSSQEIQITSESSSLPNRDANSEQSKPIESNLSSISDARHLSRQSSNSSFQHLSRQQDETQISSGFNTLDPKTASNINLSPDQKQKNRSGFFKKKKSQFTPPSAPQSDDNQQIESVLDPEQLIHVESVIQIVSVPSTASSSNEYLQVPDILTVSKPDLYKVRQIKLETYPTIYRFFSLTQNELSSLPWLNYLIDRPTDNFIFPGEFCPMQPTEMECHCELDVTGYESETGPTITPNSYVAEFESPSSTEFKSNPFIDLNGKSVINSIAFPFVREESRIGFLHLKRLSLDQSSAERFAMQLKIQAFVYTDKAVTETFFIKMAKDLSKSEGFLSSMNAPNGTESIIIPYPLNQPAYLVISLIMEDPSSEESPGSPFAYGKFLLPKDKLPEKVEFGFVAGMANETLDDILVAPPNIPMKLIAEAELVEAPVPGSTLRLTAFSNMMPTPVFTIYDIAIRMNLKISSSKDRVCFSIKLRKILPDKSPEPREIYGFLDFKTGKMVEMAYSPLRDYNEKIIFHEPMNFILDPSIVDPVEVIFTTYTLKKKKLNPIMVSKFQIKDSQQKFVNKMEVKGSLIADMKSAFSKQDNVLSCSTLFPALVCPNQTLRDAFSLPIKEPILNDPMFKNMGLYVIQKFLNKQNIPRVSFYELFDCMRMSNMADIQNYIDHFFKPEKGFTHEYIKRLIDSFDIIKDWPQPFFSIAFKGICSENDISDVDYLLKTMVNVQFETIKKSAGDLILQIPMFFDIKAAHKIAFKFINQLKTSDRFYIFKYIFSDILYIESLTCMDFHIAGKKPHSPYVPLLSLFYSTVTNAFIENNADSVGAVSFTLSILATTLELYLDPKNSRHVAKILFPLISIIFTFYDSLSVKLEKKNSLLPILLFIMKYSDKDQFMQYYQLLSSDNKPRFFEFLTILFDNSMVNSSEDINNNNNKNERSVKVSSNSNMNLKMTDVARNTFFFNEHPLNCVYEITCRFLVFLSHFESDVNCDEQIKLSIITLLLHMLSPQIQPSESYSMLFKTLSTFIKVFVDSVFLKETGLVNQLFTSIIPLTQRKLYSVRMESIGFILWLMEKEKVYRKNMSRCNLALQYAVCNSVFDLNQIICYPFWEYLPAGGSDIQVLYESLIGSISGSLIEKKITALLDLYQLYRNFPSIRGRIYLKIIEINISDNNMISAFVTQWKFCGFIAEVFKLQNAVVPGIPTEGYKSFPFIVDELPVDLSVFPGDSVYLVTKSDLFTPDSIEKALTKALELAMKANLYWLIGDTTQFLFDYLENKRKYAILKDLYNQVSKSYQMMQKDEKPQMEFARIFVKGKSVEKLGFSEAIHVSAVGQLPNYVQSLFTLLEGVGNVDFDIEPRFDSKKANDCQVVQVFPVLDEVYKLNAKTFTVDVDQNYKYWNDIMVKRFTFITEIPIPSSLPTVKVAKSSVKEISMKDYYIEKLTEFRDDLARITYSIKQVMPPPKMLQQWKSYINGLSPKPIISLMRKVFEVDKKMPYYNIVSELKEYDHSFSLTPQNPMAKSAPEEIKDLCDEIWQLMINAVPLVNTLIKMDRSNDDKSFTLYRRRLGVPLVELS